MKIDIDKLTEADELSKRFKQKTQDFCSAVEQRKREWARQPHTNP